MKMFMTFFLKKQFHFEFVTIRLSCQLHGIINAILYIIFRLVVRICFDAILKIQKIKH